MARILSSQPYNQVDFNPSMPVLTLGIARPGRHTPTATFDAVLDTGADASLIPLDILEQVGARVVDTGSLRGVTGDRMAVALYLVTVLVADRELPGIRAVAMPAGSTPIVGRDVLNHLSVRLDGPAGSVDILA